jgi:hypothetical protein
MTKRKLERSLVELGTNRPSYPAPPNVPLAGDPEGPLLDPDEPAFVLRAGDLLAPEYVEKWAADAEAYGVDSRRVAAARRCAKQMNNWRNRKGFKK